MILSFIKQQSPFLQLPDHVGVNTESLGLIQLLKARNFCLIYLLTQIILQM